MSDIILIAWIAVGSVLSIVFSLIGKNAVFGTLLGFIVAPMLPFVLLYAGLEAYLNHQNNKS